MLGASLTEVWGSDFNTKPKKEKKKKYKTKSLTSEEMDSELLIRDSDKPSLIEDKERLIMLRDDRQDNDIYQRVNPNVVTRGNPYGQRAEIRQEIRPEIRHRIEDDPDYQEFLEFKSRNRKRLLTEDKRVSPLLDRVSSDEQFNELLLYVFTGFFLLILYDSVYKLGKNSY